MVINVLAIDLLQSCSGEKSETTSRDVRKSAYLQPPLSRRVIRVFNIPEL